MHEGSELERGKIRTYVSYLWHEAMRRGAARIDEEYQRHNNDPHLNLVRSAIPGCPDWICWMVGIQNPDGEFIRNPSKPYTVLKPFNLYWAAILEIPARLGERLRGERLATAFDELLTLARAELTRERHAGEAPIHIKSPFQRDQWLFGLISECEKVRAEKGFESMTETVCSRPIAAPVVQVQQQSVNLVLNSAQTPTCPSICPHESIAQNQTEPMTPPENQAGSPPAHDGQCAENAQTAPAPVAPEKMPPDSPPPPAPDGVPQPEGDEAPAARLDKDEEREAIVRTLAALYRSKEIRKRPRATHALRRVIASRKHDLGRYGNTERGRLIERYRKQFEVLWLESRQLLSRL